MNVEANIGEVQSNAPTQRSLQLRNSLGNSMEIDLRDATRAWWNPVDWVVWIDKKIESAYNVVYDTVTSAFGVPKYDAEYLFITKDGQLSKEDCRVIVSAIPLGLLERISNTTVGEEAVHATTFAYHWADPDTLRRKIVNQRGEMSRETRAIAESLLAIVTAVGGVVVNKIKECVTLQAGGRYDLDQTGYWFFKHGDETIMVLNDDRENYEQDKTAVDLHQGDCYFWFGADVDLTNLGLGLDEYRFSCCVDADSTNESNNSPTPTPTPSLKDNAISVKLNSSDITVAQSNVDDEGIIKIPDTTWDHIIDGKEDPNQSFYNSIYINVSEINPASMLESNTATCSIDASVIDIAHANHQGKIELPSTVFTPLTGYNTNGKTYMNSIEIDVSNIATKLANNLVVNKNGRWAVLDTNDNPQDLEFVAPDNRNLKTIKFIGDSKTREGEDDQEEDEEDEDETPTPVNFGYFDVNVEPVIEFGGVTLNNINNTFGRSAFRNRAFRNRTLFNYLKKYINIR
ncbi:hypothetical protein BCR32DRAFT_301510 [Anaeromyces robustus]|uniref:Uncharacterized protein n=1 Tax=Anaeromyces robustus TaxID=1754192 RepID=A0A1Y1WZF4_9FUNG|nr:hypothetical protein BCR32DRAFT_301510 [Anaeromyces robustus]|eukprot:ORX78728.1 hypothetical protein BCR32DRAFT_301510 [Anaeromyces robustus]